MSTHSTFPTQQNCHPQFPNTYTYPQQWPHHHRPSDDRSDPRSLSSDTSMSMSPTMSPVSSQEESVALPAKAVCPSMTANSGVVDGVNHSYHWGEYARPHWDARQDGVGSMRSTQTPHRNRLSVNSDSEFEDEEDDDGDDDKESENAFVVLLRLSFLAPPFSLFASLYSFFILAFLVITTPVRLFFSSIKPTAPFSTQILHLLLPLLHRHQRLITTLTPSESRRARNPYHTPPSSSTHPTSSSTSSSTSTAHSPTWLVTIHLLSPLLILPILFAAWIAAFFWIFAMILGNPDGTERRDDGRAAVLGVRNWWRVWLRRADREEVRGRGRGPEMRSVSNANVGRV